MEVLVHESLSVRRVVTDALVVLRCGLAESDGNFMKHDDCICQLFHFYTKVDRCGEILPQFGSRICSKYLSFRKLSNHRQIFQIYIILSVQRQSSNGSKRRPGAQF